MPLLHLLLVAIIQGMTEFLPISSSGHLILLPQLTGLEDQGQLIDVAVHAGTLGAVIIYFRKDSTRAFVGLGHLVLRRQTDAARLAGLLGVATFPAVLFGLVLKVTGLSDGLRSITVIGWMMLIFGVILWVADTRGRQTKAAGDWSLRDAVVMGLWQAVALIPGTSRSGAAITGARALGYTREDAARLAMLMSIPVIIASGIILGTEAVAEANAAALRDCAIAALLAFMSALLALAFLMRLLRVVSFTPYIIYRVTLGLILLLIAYN
ncbi:MAG: undecaprenyl-diphosphate phosphatase [Rhodobacteraceae bacterium]|nr:undecaprenyl-diphosphate phosphatase [Paracoccaceae bacterium]